MRRTRQQWHAIIWLPPSTPYQFHNRTETQ
jgi:hypothetical protein